MKILQFFFLKYPMQKIYGTNGCGFATGKIRQASCERVLPSLFIMSFLCSMREWA